MIFSEIAKFSSTKFFRYTVVHKLHLISGARRKEKKDQRPRSNPGPTLFCGASATRLLVPVANSSLPIALCTGCRCAAIQRPLEDLRLETGTVCDGNALSGRQHALQCFYLLTKNMNKYGEKEAANTIHDRFVSPRYTLSPAEPITTLYQPRGIGLQAVAV